MGTLQELLKADHRGLRDPVMTAGQVQTDCLPASLCTPSPPPPQHRLCWKHRLYEKHKGSLPPGPAPFRFLPLGRIPSDQMQCSQGKQAGLGAIRGQFPQICHFMGKLPWPLHENKQWWMSSPMEKQFSIVTWEIMRRGRWLGDCTGVSWDSPAGCGGGGRGSAFPHLPCGSWERQPSASERPGGSRLEASVALWEEDPGTPRKAVASFWEAADAWHPAVSLNTNSPKCRLLIISITWLVGWNRPVSLSHSYSSLPIPSPPSSQQVQIKMQIWSSHHPAAQKTKPDFFSRTSVHSLLWHLNSLPHGPSRHFQIIFLSDFSLLLSWPAAQMSFTYTMGFSGL